MVWVVQLQEVIDGKVLSRTKVASLDRDQGWELCLWWPYNERINALLKAVAKSFGGRYKGAPYRNRVIPIGVKSAVLEQLDGIGAIRES